MYVTEIMTRLAEMGNERSAALMRKHGALETFGVSVQDLKKLQKKLKVNHPLALELFDSGNGDAMYLAGMIADPKSVTQDQLERWAQAATWHMVGEYMVSGLAAESPHGWELGLRWIEAEADHLSAIGWATLTHLISLRPDNELNLAALSGLLARVQSHIHGASNRTRYTMNGFVIGVGSYVAPLTDQALEVARSLGKVEVNMGDTTCKVPQATEYIVKVRTMGRLGKKRKHARC